LDTRRARPFADSAGSCLGREDEASRDGYGSLAEAKIEDASVGPRPLARKCFDHEFARLRDRSKILLKKTRFRALAMKSLALFETLGAVCESGAESLFRERQKTVVVSQMQVLKRLVRFARKSPHEKLKIVRSKLSETDWYWKVHSLVSDGRTAYVIGVYGSGRWYINELMLQNIGKRAKYFRDTIRIHPGPTSMIYSGHATIRHVSRGQFLPTVTNRILESAKSGFADLIFVYRHPLDSLLTNWVWWRTRMREGRTILGIWEVYKNTDDLCYDLDQKFSEFRAFADGDPAFFAGKPGPRFLSLPEFVEETELYLQSATLTLRLEDFAINPLREFSRIVEVMSVDVDLSRSHVAPPRTKPYGYLTVKEKVPQFGDFINGLDAETRRRIEIIGYNLGG
jgi:hypothetical protein